MIKNYIGKIKTAIEEGKGEKSSEFSFSIVTTDKIVLILEEIKTMFINEGYEVKKATHLSGVFAVKSGHKHSVNVIFSEIPPHTKFSVIIEN